MAVRGSTTSVRRLVKVNLGDQIYQWRQQLDEFGTANPQKKLMCKGMSMVYGSQGFYNLGTALNCGLNPWAEGHDMMQFPKETFHSMWKKGKVK